MARIKHITKRNFTVISNECLLDKRLDLSEIGLLVKMLQKPDDYNFSIRGLAGELPDGKDKIAGTLKKLEKHGYLIRKRIAENGKFSDVLYIINDKPMNDEDIKDIAENNEHEADLPDTEIPDTEKSDTVLSDTSDPDNYINTNKPNTNKPNTNKPNTEKLMLAKAVSMTREERDKLIAEFGKDFTYKCIEVLNNYKLSSGKKYKSDYYAVRNWVIRRVTEQYPGLLRNAEISRQDNDNINPFADVE
ncbi:MAG: hypothetical protein ACI4JN_03325 [Ruminococcus sp.]